MGDNNHNNDNNKNSSSELVGLVIVIEIDLIRFNMIYMSNYII